MIETLYELFQTIYYKYNSAIERHRKHQYRVNTFHRQPVIVSIRLFISKVDAASPSNIISIAPQITLLYWHQYFDD